jgi:hypothetical protein
VQLDLYTQIVLSVLSVYQSANKSICNNDTGWKFKINERSIFTKDVPVQAMNSYWGGRGTAPLILNIGHRWKLSGRTHAPAAVPPRREAPASVE